MSTSAKPYHHGDLRKTLIEVADQLIDDGDAGAFSLREVARRAGVSAPAAYRHFSDKQALLAALAEKGFNDFGRTLAAAVAAADDPLAAMGQAYVKFAVARPSRFRLMYGPVIADRGRYPELEAAWLGASEAMRSALVARSQSASDAAVTSLKLWCMVHGLSQLILDGMLPGHDPEVLARAITSAP
jgi:AcrR family transcriptional regulator